MYAQVKTGNPNSFPGYEKKVEANRLKTGQQDAVVTGTCRIGGVKTAVAVMDKRFLMGSMGIAVGEKITRLTEYAMKTATYNICCKRWSENAGRPFLAYADGKDNSGN